MKIRKKQKNHLKKLRGCFVLFIFASGIMLLNVKDSYCQQTTDDPETRVKELGIKLMIPGPPLGNFKGAVRVGNMVYLAGQGPLKDDGKYITGQVGEELNLEQAKVAARLTGISLLSNLKSEVGNLNNVKRIVKVIGMVNATSDFVRLTEVIDGFSDLMVEIFGDNGRHARSIVGVKTLGMNIPVEIEMIVEMED